MNDEKMEGYEIKIGRKRGKDMERKFESIGDNDDGEV